MIYFVVPQEQVSIYRQMFRADIFNDILPIGEKDGIEMFFETFGKHRILALDLETSGLDYFVDDILLAGIGNKQVTFQFHGLVNIKSILEHLVEHNVNILGHNIQFDIRMILAKYDVLISRVYDTMVCDQRLWMKSGYTWGLDAVTERYLKKIRVKTTRNEFIGKVLSSYKATATQLYYLKDDLVDLFGIRAKQQEYMKKFKMEFLIYGIEFPLIHIIAKAEVEGFVFDTEKWLARIEKEKLEKFDIECQLDAELQRLVKLKDGKTRRTNPRLLFSSGKYVNPRKEEKLQDITEGCFDLFGEPAKLQGILGSKKKYDPFSNNINWNLKATIVDVFAGLEEPLATVAGTYDVPIKGGTSVGHFTVGAPILTKQIQDRPDSIMTPLLELKLKHSKLEKSLSTYGIAFANKVHAFSGNIHTSFRQCFAETGRFQSGGGKKEPNKYNAQNIPAKIEYRECFTVDTEKYSLTTADYSGAELVVMASHAQDFRLIELSHSDMHSHMATICWRNIYAAKASKIVKLMANGSNSTLDEQYKKLIHESHHFTVAKDNENKHLRNKFKPMTFGCIYGMYAKKAGTTLNITTEEGQIVVNTIEGEIPNTFNMVKRASADAERQGYVILNHRTNSRAWFPLLIKQLKGQISKKTHFLEISGELSAARNIRIQGTQADFVKEASVVLDRFFVKNNIDAKILSWVHDEVVVKVPRYLDGVSKEYEEYTNLDTVQQLKYKNLYFNNTESAIKYIMIEVANRYLHNVEIDVELTTADHWLK